MQPLRGRIRTMNMYSIAPFRCAVLGVCTLLLLVMAVGCTGQEPTLAQDGPGSVAEVTGLGQDARNPGGSVGAEVEQNLALPVLIPAFGLEANTTECKFTDDPYSTCI